MSSHPSHASVPPEKEALVPAPMPWWGLLGLVWLACLPPLVVELGARDTTHTMEQVALRSSQETWLRGHEGEAGAWLMPSLNLDERVRKPPLVVWLNLAAWSDLTPSEAGPGDLVWRARLVSVGMGLLLIAAVFWAGWTLGDWRLALVGALVAGTNVFLQRQARTASYDVHLAAWSGLALAAALWAMRPTGPPPERGRAIAGWGIAGLALGAAWMSKGPLALAVVGLPVIGFVALSPGRRRGAALGAAGMLAAACAVALPWYAWAWSRVPGALNTWRHEYVSERSDQEPWYYAGLFGLMVPWTIWLIGGLFHPFVRTEGDRRRRRLMVWGWFALIFVMFSIPGSKQQRYILPIVPAAALLAGQVWFDHARLAAAGRVDPKAWRLREPHWALVVTASVLAGPILAVQHVAAAWLVEQRWFRRLDWDWNPDLPPLSWAWAMALTAVLLTLAIVGWRRHRRWRPLSAAVTTAAWMIVLMTAGWQRYGHAASARIEARAEAERVNALAGREPILAVDFRPRDRLLGEEFTFYLNRLVRHVEGNELAERPPEARWVLAPAIEEADAAMAAAGYDARLTVRVEDGREHRLWERGSG